MKKRKSFISVILATMLLMALPICAITANAVTGLATNAKIIGDADGNGNISITDATIVQMIVAGFDNVATDKNTVNAVCDTDKSGKVDISDATAIQMYIANYDVPYIGSPIEPEPTQPKTTVHKHDYTLVSEEKVCVREEYTETVGGKTELHYFCYTCEKDLTNMVREYNATNGTHMGETEYFDFYHTKSTTMWIDGKLQRVKILCDGKIICKALGDTSYKTAYLDSVHVGGETITHPAVYQYTYTYKCDGCGDTYTKTETK